MKQMTRAAPPLFTWEGLHMYRFTNYNEKELAECGEGFVALVRKHGDTLKSLDAHTEAWTEFVLDWFASTAKTGATIDARAGSRGSWKLLLGNRASRELLDIQHRTTFGEYVVDLAHTSFPSYERGDYHTPGYWGRAIDGPLCIHLAMESEFGKHGAPASTLAGVLHDAAKLAFVNASVKVMLFGTTDGARTEREKIVDHLARLRSAAQDRKPWLWIDLPWEACKGKWTPSYGLIHDQPEQGRLSGRRAGP